MVDRVSFAFGLGFAMAALVNMLLVLAKESSPGLLDWMNTLTGHHWLSHGLLVMAVFLVTGAILTLKKDPGSATGLTVAMLGATLVSTGIIATYYLFW